MSIHKLVLRRQSLTWIVGWFLLLIGTGVWAQGPGRLVDFDIPAQTMSTALVQFGKQAGLQIVSSGQDLGGISARAVKGRLTVREAIDRLIEGAGLTASFNGGDTVVIKPAEDRAKGKLSQIAPGALTPSSDVHKAEAIIVTATKREERLIDVPLSIAVVTKDDIDRRGLFNAEDYLRGIPGVNQVDSPQGQSIVIRGMETSPLNQNFGAGATTATYFGETPTSNSAGLGSGTNLDLKLVDIDRVEVLRGPQGTAFGSSAMGGAVRTIPTAPKLSRFEGKAAAGYSVTSGTGGENHNLQGMFNMPLLADRIAVRAVAYQFQDSGFYRNRAGSDPGFQSSVVIRTGAQAFAIDEEKVGSNSAKGGRIAALFQATSNLRLTLSYLSQQAETDGMPVASSGGYDQTMLQVAPEHAFRGQKGGLSDAEIDIANATAEYNLGWANLLATYSSTKSGTLIATPFQLFGSPEPLSYGANSDHRQYAGEIRLVTSLDGPWNFLGGLYSEELKDKTHFNYVWFGDLAAHFLGARGARNTGDYFDERTLQQTAAFGEVSWKFLPNFTLTGGVRTYEYTRKVQVDTLGPLFNVMPFVVNTTRNETKASGSTYRANLSYKPTDDTLLYAGWSQGFRLGKPQPGVPRGRCDVDGDGIVDGTNIPIESTTHVNSDKVDSYEVGGKFALLDRRLTVDAAVFRMDWTDVPVNVLACNVYVANAGAARSEGVELQTFFQITKALRVDVGGSWINSRLTTDVPRQAFRSGDRLPGSPKVNANLGVQYDFEIGGYKASARADSVYVGTFYGDILRTPALKAGGYAKFDASARITIRDMTIDFYVRNLTNEDAFTFRGAQSRVGVLFGDLYGLRLRPRTVGVQLGYLF